VIIAPSNDTAVGVQTVNITLSDGYGMSSSYPFKITVLPRVIVNRSNETNNTIIVTPPVKVALSAIIQDINQTGYMIVMFSYNLEALKPLSKVTDDSFSMTLPSKGSETV
jgi:hypothetical protein